MQEDNLNPHESTPTMRLSQDEVERIREHHSQRRQVPCLVVLSGARTGEMFLIPQGETTIGRGTDVEFKVSDAGSSRRHAKITRDGKRVYLEDCGSANGTYLNGKRVTRKRVLMVDDKISLGASTVLQYTVHDEMQQSVYSELYRSASSDDLTGLFTRKYLFEVLGDEFSTSIRRERPLSMMMLDIDYFKKINDTYGHPVGDEILTHIAKLARSCFREKDHLARYGGEEFAAVCPGLGGKDAARVAERIRKTIEDTFFECGENQIQATVSIGIATLDDIPHDTPKRLLEAADQALYHAKSSGRNMVVRFEETQERQAELDEDEAGQSES